jgi:hypothetical protein
MTELAHELEHDRELAVIVAGEVCVATFAGVRDPSAASVRDGASNAEAGAGSECELRCEGLGVRAADLVEIGRA